MLATHVWLEHCDSILRSNCVVIVYIVFVLQYIRKCIAKAKRPQLILVSCKELMEQIEPEKVYMPSRREDVPTLPPKSASNHTLECSV